MNYLAHIFLAQPSIESVCGNLMGDFMKGVKLDDLPLAIQRGVHNHRMVDRYTDNHSAVRALKPLLSRQRRRFSGIIADVVFDHLLIQHWARFSDAAFTDFVDQSYQRMLDGQHYMHAEMARVTLLMIQQDWLQRYRSLDGVDAILGRMAKRIRFENQLGGAMREVEPLMPEYEQAFLQLFPELMHQVDTLGMERAASIED